MVGFPHGNRGLRAACRAAVPSSLDTGWLHVLLEAFLGVYHLASQKKSETVPSRLRRVEFDSRWCKVTCADADEDFRLPRSDDGYLRFLAYLEPLDLEATKLVDYDELHKLQEGFN